MNKIAHILQQSRDLRPILLHKICHIVDFTAKMNKYEDDQNNEALKATTTKSECLKGVIYTQHRTWNGSRSIFFRESVVTKRLVLLSKFRRNKASSVEFKAVAMFESSFATRTILLYDSIVKTKALDSILLLNMLSLDSDVVRKFYVKKGLTRICCNCVPCSRK